MKTHIPFLFLFSKLLKTGGSPVYRACSSCFLAINMPFAMGQAIFMFACSSCMYVCICPGVSDLVNLFSNISSQNVSIRIKLTCFTSILISWSKFIIIYEKLLKKALSFFPLLCLWNFFFPHCVISQDFKGQAFLPKKQEKNPFTLKAFK